MESDLDKRLDLLRAITQDHAGRSAAAEVLGERIEERLRDARDAVAQFGRLLEDKLSTETDLQFFWRRTRGCWDYSQVLPRQQVLRGTVDFLLARFDGFYDLLELKGPGDPSWHQLGRGSHLRQASSRSAPPWPKHLRRCTSTRTRFVTTRSHNQWFGLLHTRDPRVIILVGTGSKLSEMSDVSCMNSTARSTAWRSFPTMWWASALTLRSTLSHANSPRSWMLYPRRDRSDGWCCGGAGMVGGGRRQYVHSAEAAPGFHVVVTPPPSWRSWWL
jgi:hypothetical protein